MQNNLILKVIITNTNGVILEEEINAISSFNEKGIFDVLPLHENFISVIRDKIIVHKSDGNQKEMLIGTGVLEVVDNKVRIYLGI